MNEIVSNFQEFGLLPLESKFGEEIMLKNSEQVFTELREIESGGYTLEATVLDFPYLKFCIQWTPSIEDPEEYVEEYFLERTDSENNFFEEEFLADDGDLEKLFEELLQSSTRPILTELVGQLYHITQD